MSTYKTRNTVIFDLDGTLLDTLDDLTNSVNHCLAKYNFPLRTRGEVRRMVGNGVRVLMEKAIPQGSKNPCFSECAAEFSSYYKAHMLERTKPYEGIDVLLSELRRRQFRLAIVSNKFDAAVKDLNQTFFSRWIPVAIGESPTTAKKPAPDSVFRAMEELHSRPEQAIYVGDSDVDLLTAKNAGLPCICVNWGFKDTGFLIEHGAECIVSSPGELLSAILSMAASPPPGDCLKTE